jgi:hypothetical protein
MVMARKRYGENFDFAAFEEAWAAFEKSRV